MRTTVSLQSPVASPRALLLALCVAILSGCGENEEPISAQPPPPLPELMSEHQHFRVALALQEGNRVPVGRYHSWLLTLTDAQRQSVYPADIAVTGGMPGHEHGLPTQPRVVEYLGEGVYRIEGLKFHMAGDWVVRFRIVTEHAQDYAEAKLSIAY